jgi:hypothetical protein
MRGKGRLGSACGNNTCLATGLTLAIRQVGGLWPGYIIGPVQESWFG